MTIVVLIVHIAVCVVLIFTVLLQVGKGAETGAAFGGGGKTAFGPRGPAGPLTKVTIACATLFMLTSLFLTYASNRQPNPSVLDNVKVPAATATRPGAPNTPLTAPAPTAPTGAAPAEKPATPAAPPASGTAPKPATPATPAPTPQGGNK